MHRTGLPYDYTHSAPAAAVLTVPPYRELLIGHKKRQNTADKDEQRERAEANKH